MDSNKYYYISTSGSFTLKSSSGVLDNVVIGSVSDGPIRIYDSAGSGGTQIAEIEASATSKHYDFDVRFAKGLHIEKPGSGKITICYT